MIIINKTELCPEPLLQQLASEIDTSDLTVEVMYAKTGTLCSGTYWPGELIRVRVGSSNSYPLLTKFHTGWYFESKPVLQRVQFATAEELVAGVFLHEISHAQDFQHHRRPRWPEVKADQFALERLQQHGIGEMLEEGLQEVGVQRVVNGNYPWDDQRFRRPSTEEECLARLAELEEFSNQYKAPRSRAKTLIQERRTSIHQELSVIQGQQNIRQARIALKGRGYAYVLFRQYRHDSPRRGDKVTILKLGYKRAIIEFEGKRFVEWPLTGLSVDPV